MFTRQLVRGYARVCFLFALRSNSTKAYGAYNPVRRDNYRNDCARRIRVTTLQDVAETHARSKKLSEQRKNVTVNSRNSILFTFSDAIPAVFAFERRCATNYNGVRSCRASVDRSNDRCVYLIGTTNRRERECQRDATTSWRDTKNESVRVWTYDWRERERMTRTRGPEHYSDERRARDKYDDLLLKPRRVRRTCVRACVRAFCRARAVGGEDNDHFDRYGLAPSTGVPAMTLHQFYRLRTFCVLDRRVKTLSTMLKQWIRPNTAWPCWGGARAPFEIRIVYLVLFVVLLSFLNMYDSWKF